MRDTPLDENPSALQRLRFLCNEIVTRTKCVRRHTEFPAIMGLVHEARDLAHDAGFSTPLLEPIKYVRGTAEDPSVIQYDPMDSEYDKTLATNNPEGVPDGIARWNEGRSLQEWIRRYDSEIRATYDKAREEGRELEAQEHKEVEWRLRELEASKAELRRLQCQRVSPDSVREFAFRENPLFLYVFGLRLYDPSKSAPPHDIYTLAIVKSVDPDSSRMDDPWAEQPKNEQREALVDCMEQWVRWIDARKVQQRPSEVEGAALAGEEAGTAEVTRDTKEPTQDPTRQESIGDVIESRLNLNEQEDAELLVDEDLPGDENTSSDPTHSKDFSTVTWFGTDYTFNPTQARCVRLLWAEYVRGGHGLAEGTIGEEIGSNANQYRLNHTFRHKRKAHPAWGTMIKPVGGGVFALRAPNHMKTTE